MANLKYKLKMRWYNLLSILKRQEFIEYRGLKFRTENLNYIVRGQLYSGTYEKDEIELIEYYIRPNYTVLELGAGLGVTSCVINRILSDEYKSKQVSIEAGLDIYYELEMNKYHNDCKFKHLLGLVLENKAIAKFVNLQHDLLKFKPLTHLVRVLDLNEYQVLNNTKFDTLVLDIEGCEWNFLTSFKLDNVHTIIVEIHSYLGKKKIRHLKEYLNVHGLYEVDHINNNFVFKRT